METYPHRKRASGRSRRLLLNRRIRSPKKAVGPTKSLVTKKARCAVLFHLKKPPRDWVQLLGRREEANPPSPRESGRVFGAAHSPRVDFHGEHHPAKALVRFQVHIDFPEARHVELHSPNQPSCCIQPFDLRIHNHSMPMGWHISVQTQMLHAWRFHPNPQLKKLVHWNPLSRKSELYSLPKIRRRGISERGYFLRCGTPHKSRGQNEENSPKKGAQQMRALGSNHFLETLKSWTKFSVERGTEGNPNK